MKLKLYYLAKVRLFFIVVFCISIKTIYSQNLTLDEMVMLSDLPIDKAGKYLVNVGWEYDGIKENFGQRYKATIYVYGKNKIGMAQSMIFFLENNEENESLMQIQLNNYEKYSKILKETSTMGCELYSNDIRDNEMHRTYTCNDFSLDFMSTTIETNEYGDRLTIYLMKIWDLN